MDLRYCTALREAQSPTLDYVWTSSSDFTNSKRHLRDDSFDPRLISREAKRDYLPAFADESSDDSTMMKRGQRKKAPKKQSRIEQRRYCFTTKVSFAVGRLQTDEPT
jgi:hypothetical protein